MPDIVTNSKARRDYHILETFEAGIVLRGTEVKSLRAGKGQIRDAFARVENGEVWLHNAHIDEYTDSHVDEYTWSFAHGYRHADVYAHADTD